MTCRIGSSETVFKVPVLHDLVTCRIGSSEKVQHIASAVLGCDLPHRQLRNAGRVRCILAMRDLPHRQLRKQNNSKPLLQAVNCHSVAQSWSFDALALGLRHFDAGSAAADRDALAALIAKSLANETHVLLQITAYVRVGAGQEVFPSQELILERGRGDKSKTLYHVDKVAAIHSQKLGNAIRTVDDWYEGAGELGPIAVEPYGSVTTQGKAYRPPSPGKGKDKLDFYNLLDDWILKDKVPALEQQHFVLAVLIRGGVFGDAGN